MSPIVSKLLKITLFCFLILAVGPVAIHAQEPDEVTEEKTVIVAPSGQLTLTLKQLGGYDNATLSWWFPRLSIRLDLPGNFEVSPTGNTFNLVTSHSPETPNRPATLQVELNQQPISTFSLTAANAISNTVRLDLPEGLLATGRNSLEVELNTGIICEDPAGSVQVLVDEESTVSFGYQQKPYPTNLGLYPFPFTEKTLLQIPVTIVLPDHPTSDDLAAAATVAAGLGWMSGGAIELKAVLASNLASDLRDNSHLIVIGKPDEHVLLNNLELPLLINETLQAGQGLLQEIVSPWNEYRLILIVSGLDDEGMLKASYALNRQAHFLGMQGPVAIVLELLPPSEPVDTGSASVTLVELGYNDEIAYGEVEREFSFDFWLPLGWRLSDSPSFVLKFNHAEILDPEESILDIKLANVPIASAILDKSNANRGELTIPLPGYLLQAGLNRLKIGIRMKLPNSDDPCKGANDERAWTVIRSDSEVFLPYQAIDLPPDLSLLPYPFSQNSGFDQTLLVLPDQPAQSAFNDLIQIAARLGQSSKPENISVHVAYASKVSEDIRQKYHLILLGLPTKNSLLREVNDYLPQPFVLDSNILKPLTIDSVAFAPDPNQDAGLLEVAISPWNENNTLLAVTGTTEAGFKLALQTLLAETSLKGNLAVVKPAINPLPGEPNQISTYSVDTRPPTSIDAATKTDEAISENEAAILASRWWQ